MFLVCLVCLVQTTTVTSLFPSNDYRVFSNEVQQVPKDRKILVKRTSQQETACFKVRNCEIIYSICSSCEKSDCFALFWSMIKFSMHKTTSPSVRHGAWRKTGSLSWLLYGPLCLSFYECLETSSCSCSLLKYTALLGFINLSRINKTKWHLHTYFYVYYHKTITWFFFLTVLR